MSEVSEQEAREADAMSRIRDYTQDRDVHRYRVSARIDVPLLLMSDLCAIATAREEELTRRDATQAARQQPITPQWCLDNGARFSAEWYVFDEDVWLRPIAGGKWIVIVSGRMLDWSAECVGNNKQLYEIWAVVPKPQRPTHIPEYATYDEQTKTLSYPMVEVISVISGWHRHDVRNLDKECAHHR